MEDGLIGFIKPVSTNQTNITMMSRIPHVLDAVIFSTTTVAAGAANHIIAIAPLSDVDYGREAALLLIPLVGAMLVSGGMIMLNPEPETRRIVVGRGIFALFTGSIAPQLLGFLHPAIQAIALKPVSLIAIGGLTAWFFYALSRPLCAGMYKRAKDRANKLQDAADHIIDDKIRNIAGVERETVTIVKETPTKVASKPEETNT